MAATHMSAHCHQPPHDASFWSAHSVEQSEPWRPPLRQEGTASMLSSASLPQLPHLPNDPSKVDARHSGPHLAFATPVPQARGLGQPDLSSFLSSPTPMRCPTGHNIPQAAPPRSKESAAIPTEPIASHSTRPAAANPKHGEEAKEKPGVSGDDLEDAGEPLAGTALAPLVLTKTSFHFRSPG